MEAPLAFSVVDHLASGNAAAPMKPVLPKDVSLIDYRFLQVAKAPPWLVVIGFAVATAVFLP